MIIQIKEKTATIELVSKKEINAFREFLEKYHTQSWGEETGFLKDKIADNMFIDLDAIFNKDIYSSNNGDK